MAKSDTDATTTTSLPKKWDTLLKKMPDFKDTADAASIEDLKKIIVSAEGNIYIIDQEKDADTKLTAAKEVAKDISGPYRDSKKIEQCKIQYALLCLESKGVDLDNN